MIAIFGSMFAGILIGYFKLIPKSLEGNVHTLILISLMGMLFALGAQVGSDPEVLSKLTELGWQSFVIAILSIIGSTLFLWGMDRFLPIQIQVEEGEE